MITLPYVTLLVSLISALASAASLPIRGSSPVSLRDFYFYACIHEYEIENAFLTYDNSVEYAREHSAASADTLRRIYEAAKTFATNLPRPRDNGADTGEIALASLCLEQSRNPQLKSLFGEK
jgi:hypothetical protein